MKFNISFRRLVLLEMIWFEEIFTHVKQLGGTKRQPKNTTSELWKLLLCFLTQRRFSDSVLLDHTTQLNNYANIHT